MFSREPKSSINLAAAAGTIRLTPCTVPTVSPCKLLLIARQNVRVKAKQAGQLRVESRVWGEGNQKTKFISHAQSIAHACTTAVSIVVCIPHLNAKLFADIFALLFTEEEELDLAEQDGDDAYSVSVPPSM